MTTIQHVHITAHSSNKKTGPIPVTTSSRDTCPDTCPLKRSDTGNGCYADGGPLAMHWNAVTSGKRGGTMGALCDHIKKMPRGQLWRHNQAGDLPGKGNRINALQLQQIARANRGKRGFTYTHKPPTAHNIAAITAANNAGFTISLSANNPAHADQLAAHGLPVVTIVAADQNKKVTFTPAGRKMVMCPAAIDDTDTMNCSRCGICALPAARRDYIVAFPAHGSSHKRAAAACGLQAAA